MRRRRDADRGRRRRGRSRPTCSCSSRSLLLVVFTYVPDREHGLVQLHQVGRPRARTSSSSGSTTTSRCSPGPSCSGCSSSACTTSSRRSCRSRSRSTSRRCSASTIRFRNLFKGMIFFPYLINGVAIAFIFLYFFQPGGVLDSVLAAAGRRRHALWLGDRGRRQLLAGRRVGVALPRPELRAVPGRHPVDPGRALRGRRDGRREPLAPVPLHHRAGHPARDRPRRSSWRSPARCRSSRSRTSCRRRERQRDVRDPDDQTAFKYHKVGLASAMAVVLLVMILRRHLDPAPDRARRAGGARLMHRRAPPRRRRSRRR